jgi:hypothetical protein
MKNKRYLVFFCVLVCSVYFAVIFLINTGFVASQEIQSSDKPECCEGPKGSEGSGSCTGAGILVSVDKGGKEFARKVWNKAYAEKRTIELIFFGATQKPPIKMTIIVIFGEENSYQQHSERKGGTERIVIYTLSEEELTNYLSDMPHEIAHAIINQRIKKIGGDFTSIPSFSNEGLVMTIENSIRMTTAKSYLCEWAKNDKFPSFERVLNVNYAMGFSISSEMNIEDYTMSYAITKYLLSFEDYDSINNVDKFLRFAIAAKKQGAEKALKDTYSFKDLNDFIDKLKKWINEQCALKKPFESSSSSEVPVTEISKKCIDLKKDVPSSSCEENKCKADMLAELVETECKCVTNPEPECQARIDKPMNEGGCAGQITCNEIDKGICSTKNFFVSIINTENLNPFECCDFAKEAEYQRCKLGIELKGEKLPDSNILLALTLYEKNAKGGYGNFIYPNKIKIYGTGQSIIKLISHEISHEIISSNNEIYKKRGLEILTPAGTGEYISSGVPIPLWIDEGLATSSETKDKKCKELFNNIILTLTAEHLISENNLGLFKRLSLLELITIDNINNLKANLFNIFYSQSMSVVNYLIKIGGRGCTGKQKVQKLLSTYFDKLANFKSINQRLPDEQESLRFLNQALNEVYGIKNINELEKLWEEDLKKQINLHPLERDADGNLIPGKEIDRTKDFSRWYEETTAQACNPCTCKE